MSRFASKLNPRQRAPERDHAVAIDYSKPQLIEAEIVETDPQLVSGPPCRACGSPRDPHARFCVACGLPFEVPEEQLNHAVDSTSVANATDFRRFHCETCGADVATSLDQRSYHCPFCDSTYVVDISEKDSGKQRPEFVIGFAVDKHRAQELFFQWIGKNSWFRPSDLATKAATEKQRGVYLPFWHFSMFASSRWSAMIGEYWYRTETYTYKDKEGKTHTATRQVQETEWWPLSGNHRKYYYGFLVSASKGLPQREAIAIQPYQLNALVRYRPYYLAGWMSEEYSVQPEEAIAVAETEFRRRQQSAVTQFMPGDTHRDLQVATELNATGSDLILLPVHVLTYRYHDRIYRFLVNGQTGKIYGEKPWSTLRISMAIIAVVLLIALVILVFYVLSRQGAL